jgi:hypothetical protein
MPRQFSLPVVQEIFPPRPAPAPGADPQLADVSQEALSQRSLAMIAWLAGPDTHAAVTGASGPVDGGLAL